MEGCYSIKFNFNTEILKRSALSNLTPPNSKKFLIGSKTKLKNAVSNQFTCSICLDIIYNCVSLQPCLHNFCGMCVTELLKVSKKCPNCKNEVERARKNPAITQIIESMGYLDQEEQIQRKADYDIRDKFKTQLEIVIKNQKPRNNHVIRRNNNGSLNLYDFYGSDFEEDDYNPEDEMIEDDDRSVERDHDSDEEEDEEPSTNCPECLVPRPSDGFQCPDPSPSIHNQCSSCFRLLPIRDTAEYQMNCSVCEVYFCTPYLNCCNNGDTEIKLSPFSQFEPPTAFNVLNFRRNIIELNVFFP